MEIITGILSALSWEAIIANMAGVFLGIIFGVIPGLTAVTGIAILIPLTFGMPVMTGMSALLGVYVGAIYAGSVTAILVNTPGTAAAAATLLEGPALREKGFAGKALTMTTVASFLGGIFSCIALIVISPQLANLAMRFGPPEYFALALFGLSIVAGLSKGALLKGITAALVGLLISTIGTDPVTGTIRFTMGSTHLLNGLSFVPALIGLFAVSQVFIKIKEKDTLSGENPEVPSDKLTWKEFRANWKNILLSSIVGTFIGIIPATGSGTASYIAYDQVRRFSKKPDQFGKGTLEGIAATETANNAVTGGALIPLLTLGIPGDVVTAVILGGLMIQGLTPGPLLFQDHADTVYGMFTALILANVFMLLFGLLAVGLFVKVLRIPQGVLMPFIIVFCVLGGFAVNNSSFDVWIVLLFGVIGYLMVRFDFPLPPMLLALILAPLLESNFRRAMIMSGQDLSIFITRPICLLFLGITFLVILRSTYEEWKMHREMKKKPPQNGSSISA